MTDKVLNRNPLKLHLGCGRRFIPDYVHIDLASAPHIDHVSDVRDLSFVPSDTVDVIYACHILEHFGRLEFIDVLKEWRRVLKPNATLRISVPDFAACANIYYERGLEDGLSGLIGLVMGGQRDQYDFHKMIFDEPFLTTILSEIGFHDIARWDWRDTEHTNIDDFSQAYLPHLEKEDGRLMSLNLAAKKTP